MKWLCSSCRLADSRVAPSTLYARGIRSRSSIADVDGIGKMTASAHQWSRRAVLVLGRSGKHARHAHPLGFAHSSGSSSFRLTAPRRNPSIAAFAKSARVFLFLVPAYRACCQHLLDMQGTRDG